MLEASGVKLSLLCFALLSLSEAASAQTKVAVVSLQRAVLESADIKKASAELEARYRPRQQEMQTLQKDLQGIQQQLQSGAGKLTPQAEQELNLQGTRKQRQLQRMDEDLRADVDRERNEILGRAGQQMREVVQKLAEEKGFDVVVDVTNTVYFKPVLDITNEAIAAYDKAHPAAPPAAPPAAK